MIPRTGPISLRGNSARKGIAEEYGALGGTEPLSEYYRGGANVLDIPAHTTIKTAAEQRFSNYRGTEKYKGMFGNIEGFLSGRFNQSNASTVTTGNLILKDSLIMVLANVAVPTAQSTHIGAYAHYANSCSLGPHALQYLGKSTHDSTWGLEHVTVQQHANAANSALVGASIGRANDFRGDSYAVMASKWSIFAMRAPANIPAGASFAFTFATDGAPVSITNIQCRFTMVNMSGVKAGYMPRGAVMQHHGHGGQHNHPNALPQMSGTFNVPAANANQQDLIFGACVSDTFRGTVGVIDVYDHPRHFANFNCVGMPAGQTWEVSDASARHDIRYCHYMGNSFLEDPHGPLVCKVSVDPWNLAGIGLLYGYIRFSDQPWTAPPAPVTKPPPPPVYVPPPAGTVAPVVAGPDATWNTGSYTVVTDSRGRVTVNLLRKILGTLQGPITLNSAFPGNNVQLRGTNLIASFAPKTTIQNLQVKVSFVSNGFKQEMSVIFRIPARAASTTTGSVPTTGATRTPYSLDFTISPAVRPRQPASSSANPFTGTADMVGWGPQVRQSPAYGSVIRGSATDRDYGIQSISVVHDPSSNRAQLTIIWKNAFTAWRPDITFTAWVGVFIREEKTIASRSFSSTTSTFNGAQVRVMKATFPTTFPWQQASSIQLELS